MTMTDTMIKLAGVRFSGNWKVYDFDATEVDIVVGDKVIVDTDQGLELAHVVRIRRAPVPIPAEPTREQKQEQKQEQEQEQEIELSIEGEEETMVEHSSPASSARTQKGRRRVLRKTTEEDIAQEAKNLKREKEAFTIAQEIIAERELPMKLIRAGYSFDMTRVIFFFFSETRVDFRELVKDLAYKLKSRIEMRQIGIRDVARMIGGLGSCGREFCCASFLKSFQPVSIRMAKKQEMVLNPAKISGVCGRLLCCLSYEYEMYDEIKKDLTDMQETATKDKREEAEHLIAEQQRVEDRGQEKRYQEPRREKQKENTQEAVGRPDVREDYRQEEKSHTQAEEQPRDRRQQKPEKQQPPTQKPPQSQQDGEKSGRKRKRRFRRKKKRGNPHGENKPQNQKE